MSNANDRKMELERKKAKLAQIREEKKRKEEEKQRQLLQNANENETSRNSPPETKSALAHETEQILTELGISPHAPEIAAADPSPEKMDADVCLAGQSASPTTVYKARGKVLLDKATLTAVDYMPKEQVLYSKTTQTIGEPPGAAGDFAVHGYEWDDEFSAAHAVGAPRTSSSTGGVGSTPQQASPVDEVFSRGLAADFGMHHITAVDLLPHVELVKPAAEVRSDKTLSDEKSSMIFQKLSEEETQKVLSTPNFKQFIDKSSKILERALTEKENNIFVDYSKGEDVDEKTLHSDVMLSTHRIFQDEKWSKGRCVSSLDFSFQHPELLAVAYSNNVEAPGEPEGVVLVWNSKFKKTTPEYIFHCQSRVLSVSWAKFHPNLLLGGTYCGQICLWDNRQNKKTPVQKSPLSASAHTHPVYCIKVIGTQNAHNLVTVSTDGRLCSWSLDMLAKPLETLDLQLKQSKQVNATCLDFASNDVNNFLIGAEDGCAYAACRHGQKAGVADSVVYEAHAAFISGLACHGAQGGTIDFSHLFLTSSFDWSIKLWDMRVAQVENILITGFKESKPLWSFESNSDYVMDVAWSPVNPALFASVDCRGRLDLWHLNLDLELPQATAQLPDDSAANKIIWLPSGLQIAVGDDSGRVTIFDINEKLAIPRPTEWNQLAKVLNDAKQSQNEAEELLQAMSLSATPLH